MHYEIQFSRCTCIALRKVNMQPQTYGCVHIDVQNVFYVFYYFYKKRLFNVFFIFLNISYFLVANIFYPSKPSKILLNLLNSCLKRILSDELNKAAMKNSLMNSPQTMSCIFIDSNYTDQLFISFD